MVAEGTTCCQVFEQLVPFRWDVCNAIDHSQVFEQLVPFGAMSAMPLIAQDCKYAIDCSGL